MGTISQCMHQVINGPHHKRYSPAKLIKNMMINKLKSLVVECRSKYKFGRIKLYANRSGFELDYDGNLECIPSYELKLRMMKFPRSISFQLLFAYSFLDISTIHILIPQPLSMANQQLLPLELSPCEWNWIDSVSIFNPVFFIFTLFLVLLPLTFWRLILFQLIAIVNAIPETHSHPQDNVDWFFI